MEKFSPEQLNIKKERDMEQGKMLSEGAEYDEEGQLIPTEKQIDKAKSEMDKELRVEYLKSEEGKAETKKLIEEINIFFNSKNFDKERDSFRYQTYHNMKSGVFLGFKLDGDEAYLEVFQNIPRDIMRVNVRDFNSTEFKILEIIKNGRVRKFAETLQSDM